MHLKANPAQVEMLNRNTTRFARSHIWGKGFVPITVVPKEIVLQWLEICPVSELLDGFVRRHLYTNKMMSLENKVAVRVDAGVLCEVEDRHGELWVYNSDGTYYLVRRKV